MTIDEEKSLRNEIDTLNKNIERKDAIMLGLYNVIVKTENIDLIAEANIAMLDANLNN